MPSIPTPKAMMSETRWLHDGFGNVWEKCGKNCKLEIVRPGKVQCGRCEYVNDHGPVSNASHGAGEGRAVGPFRDGRLRRVVSRLAPCDGAARGRADQGAHQVKRERPILMSGQMVHAILDGRKTQTRRVIAPQPDQPSPRTTLWRYRGRAYANLDAIALNCSPYGAPGDGLWVRESFYFTNVKGHERDGDVIFAADHPDVDRPPMGVGRPWRPSIHMPRWACRLVLEITEVRVERLQEISGADAEAEGVEITGGAALWPHINRGDKMKDAYRALWDSLNPKRAPWDSNPFVWAITFRRLK